MTLRKWTSILLICVDIFLRVFSCPTSCMCKWKNGKQTVECPDRGLLVIPEGMDSGTQVLEFSGNNLKNLYKEKFLKMDLTNLQRIYLSRCQITNVEDGTFKGLTNLVELDLSGNLLETVPSMAFIDCPSLMRLVLSSNPIKILWREAFSYLYFLNTLELSKCEISQVEEGAFEGLHSLEWLRLNGNHLRTIRGTMVLPENVRGVELQGNMWECDCHLLELHSWLETFSIPQAAEPVCAGPPKLSRRPVKSIPSSELACLPDVSPTTFYLEIGEGKNVSLLCQINAVPEAHVSWWFQGQLLQNDTMVSSDMRLIYYIEEGTEDKRSELFIYNTNTQDNGTFICSAENPAGTVQSNFTIRIILKEEPNYEVVVLPFEFLLIILSASGVSLVVICFALILSIIKCQTQRRAKAREKMENAVLNISTKDSLLHESIDEYSDLSKEGSNTTLVDRAIMLYSTQTSEELFRSMSPLTVGNQLRSPPSLSCYQLEQNPDLINDTESMGRRRDGDGEDKHVHIKYEETNENFELSSNLLPHTFTQDDEKRCNRELYRLPADVHLNPVGLLNSANSRPAFNGNCYRTLPYNRTPKRQSKECSTARFRDTDILSQAEQSASFDHYSVDIRYTADGYPVRIDEQETHFSDADSVRSCCSAPPAQWAHITPITQSNQDIKKKSVGAQTQTELIQTVIKPSNRSVCSAIKISETLTESPDEGYEGDSIIDSNH